MSEPTQHSPVQLVASHGRESDGGGELDGSKFRQDILELLSQAHELHKLPQDWITNCPDERLKVMMNLLENEDTIAQSPDKYGKLYRLTVELRQHTQITPNEMVVALDSFTPLDYLREGRAGKVYRTTLRQRSVVVEFLLPDHNVYAADRWKYTQDVFRDAIRFYLLKHENILEFIGVTEHPELGPGVVLPLMEGGSILRYMDERRDTTFGERFQWLHDISRGVDYLHSIAHIAHGDLKAANVLMTSDGIVKIAGLGPAVFSDDLSFGSQRRGHVHWTPPEQLWLDSPDNNTLRPTYSGDIYSFAITCIEILTGKQPWGNSHPVNQTMRILQGERPQIPENPGQISRELASVLPLWWHSNPDQRPSSRDVVAFFDEPTVRQPKQTFHPLSQRYNPSEELMDTLCLVYENEATFLQTWAMQDFRQQDGYPECPVHILCEEMPFLKGLYSSCDHDIELVDTFCYPALEVILQRGRQITTRSLFPSNANRPSQTTHPLSLLGYELLERRADLVVSRQSIEHIKKLIADSSPGILVLLSGRSGWLNDQGLADFLLDLVIRKEWQVELVVWASDAPYLIGYRILSRIGKLSVVHLEKFFDSLFPALEAV